MTHRTLTSPGGETIAYRTQGHASGAEGPGLVWLSGFNSNMDGAKASALSEWAGEQGRAFTRFDYSGHGLSQGALSDGTIGKWLAETQAVLDQVTRGPQILIGSSMGGWLALLAATAHRQAGDDTIAGLLLIAPAVDMTERLIWPSLDDAARAAINDTGTYLRPSAYGDGPYPITRKLIEDGRRHLLLDDAIDPGCAVRILQGMADPDVPWRHALRLVEQLSGDDVVLTLIGDGDHRLSRTRDIARMLAAAGELIAQSD